MARNYLQGKFTPKNPNKYAGDVNNIVFRSSWERRAMVYFDDNSSILKWSSEEFIINYISPVDQRPHRYFPDFLIKYRTKGNEIKKAVIEIKPATQTKMPKKTKRITESYLEAVKTFNINLAKWSAAEKWCKENCMDFLIITEKELGLDK